MIRPFAKFVVLDVELGAKSEVLKVEKIKSVSKN